MSGIVGIPFKLFCGFGCTHLLVVNGVDRSSRKDRHDEK